MLDRPYWTMIKMAFFLLVALGICGMCVNTGALKLATPVLMGPSAGLLRNVTEFNCRVNENPHNLPLYYELFTEDDMKKSVGVHTSLSGESATFPAYLTFKYDGRLICKASGHNNSYIEPSYSDWLDFRIIDPVDGAFILPNPSPGDLWKGESLTLQCNISKGNYVSFSWLLNDRPVQRHYGVLQNQLTIRNVSSSDSGRYVCIASNRVNDNVVYKTRSNATDVHVKEPVSNPGISFDVFINVEKSLTANVTCRVAAGTPPINFTLLNGSQIITESHGEHLTASFEIPILLDQSVDLVQCQASNGRRLMKSETLNLTVESVGGAVSMRVKKAESRSFQVLGVWLHCSVEKGTFPHFFWFLNNSRLEGIGPFYSVFGKDHSGLTLSLGLRSAGIYHCEAGNKFSNATRLRSQKTLITKEALNRIPAVVAVIVFTCFSVLIIAVTACCLYGVVRRRRASSCKLKQYVPEMSNVVDDDDDDDDDEEHEYENEEGIYESDEDKYAEEDDVGVIGEYREDTEIEQSSSMEDSDEGEEEDETNK